MPSIHVHPIGICKGVVGFLVLFITALLGTVFMMGPILPLMVIRPQLFRWIMDYLTNLWLLLFVGLIEAMGVTVATTGDTLHANEGSIIIMNHRTRLDWMFFMLVLYQQSTLRTEKIILKNEIKRAPGIGWAMQVACYIFLKRHWETDKPWMSALLHYFGLLRYKGQFLIFPEGTNYDRKSKESSDKFAKKNNLPEYSYCLHPRTTGFVFLTQELRQKNLLDTLYDVTVTYPDTIPELGELNFMLGTLPSKVGFHIRRHPNTSLPRTREGLEYWCIDKWQEKETALENFYTQGKHQLLLPGDKGDESIEENKEKQGSGRGVLYGILAFWVVFFIAAVCVLVYSSIARWYFLIVSCFFVYQLVVRGGIESIIMESCKRYYKQKERNK